ncbi:hypothetical protein D3D03_05455 [Exiguobacterium sp. RIT452]|jgi:hypothetical protein|uniref:Uncharacterized protein n=1 Tax=Exiguobacterium undae TaxID=169177 RepID=A0ABX2VC42_9BACL|nr:MULTISPECIES: hypothetical protein [Exiguobacterium]OAN15271.1 hypothetical protein A3783_04840 [Exiguobacterium undae]RJP02789.1 hypothetical protein D3D03_05455 [Exiguobacterium sp. RIT452]
MNEVCFLDEHHYKRYHMILRRLNARNRSNHSFQSILFLATGNLQLLQLFSDYFFPETGEFFYQELLAEPVDNRIIEVERQLLVQLYNGRTTLTVIEVIDQLNPKDLELALGAIQIRSFGADEGIVHR